MLFKNHFFFSLVLTGILFISSDLRAENFTSLSQCRQHFQTSVQTGSRNVAEMDAWCKTKMTELDFCAESALLNAMAANSFSAAQVPQIRAGFQALCQRQIAARAAGANAVAGTPAAGAPGAGSAGAAFDASGAPIPPKPPTPRNCVALAMEQQAACTMSSQTEQQNHQAQLRTYQSNLQAHQQRLAQAEQARLAQQQAQQQQQRQNNMQATQMMMNTGMQIGMQSANQAGGGGVPNYAQDIKVPNGYTIHQPSATTGPNSVPQIKPAPGAPPEPTTVAAQVNAPTPSASAVAAGGKETVAAVGDGAAPAVKAIEEAPFDPNKVDPPKSPLAIQAEERKKKVEPIIKEGENVLTTVQRKSATTYGFTGYPAAARQSNTELQTYLDQKDPCVKEAERANKLCIEGNSDGVKAVKGLVDYSGPILGAMSSVVNACSSTKKVMNLAQMGLTVAKGVCVASKVTCDTKCAASFKNLEKVTVAIEKEKAALDAEIGPADTFCHQAGTAKFNEVLSKSPSTNQVPAQTAYTTVLNACRADFEMKYQKAQVYTNKLISWAGEEKQVKGGTTNEMIANCQAKGKDIAIMATNILTMAMGKMSAAKCEKEVSTASTGPGGNPQNVTTAEYCAAPETKGSDFCKCQTNPSAEGCAGALAGGGGAGALPDERRGANLNLQKGPNGFAGGTAGGRPGSSGITVGAGGGPLGSGVAAAQLNGGSGVGGSAGAGTGSAASGGGSGGAEAQAANAEGGKPGDEKKWSFGAFSSMSGGGGSGDGRGGSSGNGNAQLSEEQQGAIERKLASDRYAAEVTTSTGPNNFDKIKQAVRNISDSLEPNQ